MHQLINNFHNAFIKGRYIDHRWSNVTPGNPWRNEIQKTTRGSPDIDFEKAYMIKSIGNSIAIKRF
jgi:hypothetical protein